MSNLSIILVNYKTPQLVIDCLNSIMCYDNEFEIIIVDNQSNDNSEELILSRFPTVKWVQMNYNAGFARANNVGIRKAQGDVVLLLNSDTLNVDNAIAKCYQSFRSSEYVACGVQLLNEDGSSQISGNYFMKGSLNNLLPLPYVGDVVKAIGSFLHVDKPHADSSREAIEVDWINGAFLMVKQSSIRKAGLMDEDFFLYAEEAEWCYRLRKHGKLVIYGGCQVIHLQGESSNDAFKSEGKGYYNLYDRKGLQIMLSNFVRIRKQNGVLWFLFHLLIYTLTIPIFLLVGILRRIMTLSASVTFHKKWLGFTSNVLIIWRHFFIILFNRSHFYKVL